MPYVCDVKKVNSKTELSVSILLVKVSVYQLFIYQVKVKVPKV